jgi:hypothetical protein
MCLRRRLGKSANVSRKQKDISSLHDWTKGEAGLNCRNGNISRSPSSISQRSTGCRRPRREIGRRYPARSRSVDPTRASRSCAPPYHASGAQTAPPEVPLTDKSSSSSREAVCRIFFSAPAVEAVWLPPPWQAIAIFVRRISRVRRRVDRKRVTRPVSATMRTSRRECLTPRELGGKPTLEPSLIAPKIGPRSNGPFTGSTPVTASRTTSGRVRQIGGH